MITDKRCVYYFIISFLFFFFFFEKGGILIFKHLVILFYRGTRKAEIQRKKALFFPNWKFSLLTINMRQATCLKDEVLKFQ